MFVLIYRIVTLTERDSITLYVHAAKISVQRLSIVDSRRAVARQLLNDASCNVGAKVAKSSSPTSVVTAQDVGVSPGNYIVDTNLAAIRNYMRKNDRTSVYFTSIIGDKIDSPDNTLAQVVTDEQDIDSSELANLISEAVIVKRHDLIFDFDSFLMNMNRFIQ